MPDERAETLAREATVLKKNSPPRELGGDQSTAAVEQPQPVAEQSVTPEAETPMIPKFRYDDLNQKYQELKSQPKEQTPDLERVIEAKLAPLRVQMETDRVLKTYEDFPQYSDQALEQIKKNPSLSLEEGYILAKAKSGNLASEAKEQGKNEAYNTIERKQSTRGETQGRKAEPKSLDELIRDKSVSLKEIERMLPRS